QRFKELFNFAVFPFYWASYEKNQGKPEWRKIVPAIEWCKANGIRTKGHPLVWTYHAGVPEWLSRYPADVREELLKARVINITAGFKGRIDIWDVVNEPLHGGTWNSPEGAKGPGRIEEIADYVEPAFRWAYMANPEAQIILNEFHQITDKTIRERFFELVQELKKRGVPVSGLGIQAHMPGEEWYSPEDLWETFDYFSQLGYPLHITEFIPQSAGRKITGGWRKGVWTLDAQAEFAEQFYRLCFGHPSIASITWWGLTDRYIWLPGGGLTTEEYTPKPAYETLKRLIHEEWKTSLSAVTDSEGLVRFRGFYGRYEVKLTTGDGRTHPFKTALKSKGDNRRVFTVKSSD
ncbi:MAG: endo-1,4-beta-xylanase, partial [Gemmatimonadota bacterium]|nr:endo-1,4-beta-xylanase [Gemmatimonadota bacterium]